MALTYIVQHTLTFSPNTGEDYQWELDILRGYEGTTAPSWASTPPTTLVGSDEPFVIEWLRDYDVYKPIQGSTATVNLIVERAGQYPDFSQAGRFEYQARLRYRRSGESTLNDYWCGFINAVDGTELVGTFPFNVSFTSTDGLGRLEESTLEAPSSQDSENLFSVLLESVYETGLNLPVYVSSGIRNSLGDALTTVTANGYYRYSNEEKTELRTRKEFIEGFLSTFNCKITQSYGRWYIYNASTHGRVNDLITWNTYEVPSGGTAYTPSTAVTEELRLVIDGSSSQDLVPANQDLQLNTRRPYGSVECVPDGFVERDYVTNGCFDAAPTNASSQPGFEKTSDSRDSSFTIVGNGEQSGTGSIAHPTCTYAIRNTRNRYRLDNRSAYEWFHTVPLEIDLSAPIEVSFDHVLTFLRRSQLDNARLNWSLEVEYNTPYSFPNYGLYNLQYNSLGSGITQPIQQIRTVYWNHGRGEWSSFRSGEDHKIGALGGTIKGEESTSDDLNEWKSVSLTAHSPLGFGGTSTDSTGTVTLRFYYSTGRGDTGRTNGGSDTGRLDQLVTNISIKNSYDSDITNPTYERIQEDYTSTLTYDPIFADNAPVAVYQRLDQDGYWRPDNLLEASSPVTLEEIVTQQKLNDFKVQFQYYEGNFINLSTDPLGPHHKLLLNWGNYQSVPANGTTPTSMIFNGGTFRVKENQFDSAFYVPDQAIDVAPGRGRLTDGREIDRYGFFFENVNLVARQFPGRTNQVTYWLGLRIDGLNDIGGALQIPDSSGVEPGGTGYVATTGSIKPVIENGVLRITGLPQQQVSGSFIIAPEPGYDASASNMRWFGDGGASFPFFSSLTTEDELDFVDSIQITDLGANLLVEYQITLPGDSEYEELHIAGEVDPFVGDNNTVNLTLGLNSSVTNSNISSSMRSIVAPEGSVIPFQAFITPNDGFRLNAGTFTSGTLPDYVVSNGFTQVGNSVLWSASVTIPADSLSSSSITLNGSAPTVVSTSITTSDITINFGENITNANIVRTRLNLTGAVGTAFDYDLLVFPASGHTLTAGNFTVTETVPNANVMMGNATQLGDAVSIPISGTFPATDATATFVVNGSAQEIGANTSSVTVTYTNNIANSSLSEGATEVFTGVPGTTLFHTLEVTPGNEYQFSRASNAYSTSVNGSVGSVNTLVTDQTIFVNSLITFGSSDSTGSVTIGGAVVAEPYSVAFNINSSELSLAGANMVREVVGYDVDDFGNSFSTNDVISFLVSPNIGSDIMFTSVNDISVSVPSPYTNTKTLNSDNTIRVNISGVYPSSGGDSEVDVNISTVSTPTLIPATRAQFGLNEATRGYASGSITVAVTANGAWSSMVTESSGIPLAGYSVSSSGTSDQMGSVTITYPTVTEDQAAQSVVQIITTSASGVVSILGNFILTRAETSNALSEGFVTEGWALNGGSGNGGSFVYIDGRGITRSANVPSGDSIPVCATRRPTIVEGSATGANVTPDSTLTCSTGQEGTQPTSADTVGGRSIEVVSALPANPSSNTIYFVI